MTRVTITIAVEGNSDETLARRLLQLAGFNIAHAYIQRGKSRLDEKIRAFNAAAAHAPWLVLRELDQDADCAPKLIHFLLPCPSRWMCLRIAVRAAESWLIADRKNLSRFLGVPANKIPNDPDEIADPKTELVNLARKSKKRPVREDMVPATNGTTRVGRAYVSRLIEFADAHWDPTLASKNSESLATCLEALARLKESMAPPG